MAREAAKKISKRIQSYEDGSHSELKDLLRDMRNDIEEGSAHMKPVAQQVSFFPAALGALSLVHVEVMSEFESSSVLGKNTKVQS